MKRYYSDSEYTKTLEGIIDLDHKLSSGIVSLQINSNYLKSAMADVLKETCSVLGFKQGEFRLFLDEKENIPRIGEVKSTWKIIKPVASIGFEENELNDEQYIDTREKILDPNRRGPVIEVMQGNVIEIYRNKNYIKELEQKGILRQGYWEEYLEDPPTQDNRNIFIPVTRYIPSGVEVPAYANFSIPNYDIKEDESVDDQTKELARKTVNRITGYMLHISMVNELNKSIKERERLASIAAIGTLAGEVAHDLGNLGLSIKQNTRLALRSLKKGEYDDVERKLVASLTVTENLTSLSGQFKNIAPSRGKYENADIHRSLKALLVLEEGSFKHQGLEVRIIQDFDPNLREVYHDVGGISQVYINLLRNSQRAIIEKKETMKARNIPYKPEINVTTRNLGETAQISFYDNGIGISEKNLSKLFDPSFTTKTQSESVGGYGLSSSYRIIKEHKGDIKIRSKECEYTEVILTLPTRREQPAL